MQDHRQRPRRAARYPARRSQHRVAIVAPDTSPRGEGVADDPAYDLGQGAGFYVDATQAPWSPHFKMESYITRDLIGAVEAEFPLVAKRSIFGHSMGGHGALTLAMKHPQLFKSVSAFAPIASPTRCPWGEKALGAYFGADREAWRAHDASLLIEAGKAATFDDILIDQGTDDPFLAEQLKPELLEQAARAAGQKLTCAIRKATITRTSLWRRSSPNTSPFTPRAWCNRHEIAGARRRAVAAHHPRSDSRDNPQSKG